MAETSQPLESNLSADVKGFETRRKKRILAIPIRKELSESPQSRAMDLDPWAGLADTWGVIAPPFDLLNLTIIPEHSPHLPQMIEAMEVNVDGLGYTLKPLIPLSENTPHEVVSEVADEGTRLRTFFRYCWQDGTFTRLRRLTRADYEKTGNAYWEILRSPTTGQIDGFEWCPSYTMRLTKRSDQPIPYVERRLISTPGQGIQWEEKPKAKRFRRYVQERSGIFVYFKEFGDPRRMNYKTGEYETADRPVPLDMLATEIFHWRLWSTRTPYGLPRWIGNILSVLGTRSAEEVNYRTLKSNNVPSYLLLVSGGSIDRSTEQRIADYIETQVSGQGNFSQMLIIEAEPARDVLGETSQVKLEAIPMVQGQVKDQLFQEYTKNNGTSTRSAFRLPPIYIGLTEDYSRATADTSRTIAEEQVFGPERSEFDESMNRWIMPSLDAKWHSFVTRSPSVTNDADMIRILGSAERTGGLTPRISREVMGDVLNRDLVDMPWPKGIDPDMPHSITLQREKARAAGAGAAAWQQEQMSGNGQGAGKFLGWVANAKEQLEKELARRFDTIDQGELIDDKQADSILAELKEVEDGADD